MAGMAVATGLGSLEMIQTRNAILLKIALEGKDFQTARKEVEARANNLGQTTSSDPRDVPPVAQDNQLSGDFLEITTLSMTHMEVEITTADAHLSIEATHLEARRTVLERSSRVEKKDPLVIDLDGGEPDTTGSKGAKPFDLEGNGSVKPTSFVTRGSAFLALDRNGDGRINDGKELFGDQHGATDGYEELRKFDADNNGRIDSNDPVYSQLLMLYGDGRTTSLSDSGIASINLDARGAAQTVASGDDILRSATATLDDGRHVQTYAMGLQRFDAMV